MGVGRPHRDRQPLGELAVGVDDLADAAGLHRRRRLGRGGARDRPDPRVQQPGRHRDRDVGAVVAGERQHADALALAEPGEQQRLGRGDVAGERRRVGDEVAEVEVGDPRLVGVERHEPMPHAVEGVRHHAAGLAEPAEQVEGLAQAPHRSREARHDQRRLEALVLHQPEQAAEQVGPADHRRVDRHRHPHALGVGEGVGQLAEADRRRGVGDEVEGLEDRRPPGVALGIDAGDQREAGGGGREDHDQEDQRRPQPPDRDEQEAAHLSAAASSSRPP